MRRFGELRSFAAGEALARVGEVGPGLMIILSGKVDVFQTHGGERSLIVTHGPGSFMGELAQLGGRPALVDAIAQEPVEAIVIPPAQLRALLDRRGRARRAHHARADPAPHGSDRDRRRAGR